MFEGPYCPRRWFVSNVPWFLHWNTGSEEGALRLKTDLQGGRFNLLRVHNFGPPCKGNVCCKKGSDSGPLEIKSGPLEVQFWSLFAPMCKSVEAFISSRRFDQQQAAGILNWGGQFLGLFLTFLRSPEGPSLCHIVLQFP